MKKKLKAYLLKNHVTWLFLHLKDFSLISFTFHFSFMKLKKKSLNNLYNYWYRNFGIKSLSCKTNFEFWLIELAFKSKLLHRKGQKIAFLQNTENSIQNKFGAYFPLKIMHLWRISFSKRWGQSNIQSSALILFLSFPLNKNLVTVSFFALTFLFVLILFQLCCVPFHFFQLNFLFVYFM